MKSPFLYMLEFCLCSDVLLALYKTLFEKHIPFRACRVYLLVAVAVSAVIPALHIPVYPADPAVDWSSVAEMTEWAETETAEAVPAPVVETVRGVDGEQILPALLRSGYAVVVLVLIGWFAVRLAFIGRLRRRARLTDCGDYVLAEHANVRAPFSFLRTIYLGDGFEGRCRSIVLRHEASHVRHRHSVERIAMELIGCILWFNPFVWIAARWLREVQEWEADRDVLDGGCDLTEYRMTLFSQLFGYNPDMTCGLSHSFTKNRFMMMTRNKWGRFAGWRLAAALPFVGGMLCLCSFTTREAEAADDKTAVIRIGADGAMTFNGRPMKKEQMLDFIATEREKLAESERSEMTVKIASEPAKTANPQIFVEADGAVSLDGETLTLAELESKLKAWRETLSPQVRTDCYVELTSDASTPMLAVAEVKNVLRRIPLLKLRYRIGESDVVRILAPLPTSDGKVQVVEVVPKKRNSLLVLVDRSGQVQVKLLSDRSAEIVPMAELSGKISDFVSGKVGEAEREMKSFELPDGRSVDYLVSQGIVCLATDPRTPYDSFVSAQQAITAGFNKVREAVAREWFDKGYAALTDAERQLVGRAVPLKAVESKP